MFMHVATERRLLGFDTGDWSIFIVGIALACCLIAFV
jgi:hypothetical protein